MGCYQEMLHLHWQWCTNWYSKIQLFIVLEQDWKNVCVHASNNLANSANFSLIYRQVVMVLQYFDAWYSAIKIYVVDYPGLNHEVISVQKDDMRNKEWTLFNLRSNIYLAHFYQNTAIFYHLDIKPNKSLFLISLQGLKHPTISGLDVYNQPNVEALPFCS